MRPATEAVVIMRAGSSKEGFVEPNGGWARRRGRNLRRPCVSVSRGSGSRFYVVDAAVKERCLDSTWNEQLPHKRR